MPEFLLFRLYAPLASWGDTAVGEFRPTDNRPGKAAIAGLLGAALGIRREEDEAHRYLHDGYGLAVRTDLPGHLLRDFHTAQVPPARRNTVYRTRREELAADDLNTILSTRDYLADAVHVVCLWAKAEARHSLAELCEALARPRFTLYLGRKACPPALPLEAQVISADSLKDAFAKAKFQPCGELDCMIRRQKGVDYYWEDGVESGFGKFQTVRRKDRLIHRGRWQFGEREKHQALREDT
jgi:CRISPR system Cascade subunit CasD